MQIQKKIEIHFSRIEAIRYDNVHGGAYAYVQFLAYTRELLNVLRPLKLVEKEVEFIESVNWLFNEYLAAKFTPRQRSIFEEKMIEMKELFQNIRDHLKQFEREHPISSRYMHRVAA